MHTRLDWTSDFALNRFAALATVYPDDFLMRFDWNATAEDGSDGFSLVEIDAIYAEVISLIPAGQRVLEIGCGNGRFAAALRAARPAGWYRGLDIVPANIATAKANLPAENFVLGNALEYLHASTPDWDFIVSIGCLFHRTDTRDVDVTLNLLDARSSNGFLVLANPAHLSPLVEAQWASIVSTSQGVGTEFAPTESVTLRVFLTDVTLKRLLAPMVVTRTGTSAVAPERLPGRCRIVEGGVYNKVLARRAVKDALDAGEPAPPDIVGAVTSGGLVTGTDTVAIAQQWVRGVRARPVA